MKKKVNFSEHIDFSDDYKHLNYDINGKNINKDINKSFGDKNLEMSMRLKQKGEINNTSYIIPKNYANKKQHSNFSQEIDKYSNLNQLNLHD